MPRHLRPAGLVYIAFRPYQMKEYAPVKIMHGILWFIFFFVLSVLYYPFISVPSYSKRMAHVAACDSLWSDLVRKTYILVASDLRNQVLLLY